MHTKTYQNLSRADYEFLYRKWQDRPMKAFIPEAEVRDGIFVDLCTGPGRLALAAAQKGYDNVYGVDESVAMLRGSVTPDRLKVRWVCADVLHFLQNFRHIGADVIACKQAINYWLSPIRTEMERHLILVEEVLVPGGIFVFNTFHKLPPPEWQTRAYTIEEVEYAEMFRSVVQSDGSYRIPHFQTASVPGLGETMSHFTEFWWLDVDQIEEVAKRVFSEVELVKEGASILFRCTKAKK